MKKRILSIVLVVALLLSFAPACVFADSKARTTITEEAIATKLKGLSLFKGTSDTEFDLNRAPSRIEALVIMLRLLGKESEILAGSFKHPFNDVPKWANNYVGYAYQNGLTNGISATEFGTSNATAAQFVTFVLRAMGYQDGTGKDFNWRDPFTLAKSLGVVTDPVVIDEGFLRADCASISWNALFGKMKDSATTLAEKLIADGVFTKAKFEEAKLGEIVSDPKKDDIPHYNEMLKAYGMRDMKWHDNPKTDLEWTENFLISYLKGDWEYDTKTIKAPKNVKWSASLGDYGALGTVYAALVGEWLDCYLCYAYAGNDNKFYITTDGQPPVYTKEELASHVIETYLMAELVKAQFEESSYNKNFTTQRELAEAYAEFLTRYYYSLGWQPYAPTSAEKKYIAEHPGSTFLDFYNYVAHHPEYSICYMETDGAYPLLKNLAGDCGSHASLFNILMNLNGIEAYGLNGATIYGEVHVVSYLVLDGKTCLCDWLNYLGVCDLNDAESKLEFRPLRDSMKKTEFARFKDEALCLKEYKGIYY